MSNVRFGLRVDSNNGHHVHFRLFAATGGQHLGSCGHLVMTAEEFTAFKALLGPALTDRSDPPAPRLERVRTDDGCYRVLGQGVGAGSITYDPMVENLDISWLPVNHPAAGRSAAGITAGVLDLNGEDALYEHLETLFQQLSNQVGRDSRG